MCKCKGKSISLNNLTTFTCWPRSALEVCYCLLEEIVVFVQDELHYLVLEDHVHRDIPRLHLRPKQRWAEHNCHILYSHTIILPIFNNPVKEIQ